MTVTSIPPGAAAAATARHDLVAALTGAAVYFETHPGARLPESPMSSVRPRGATREEKLADLDVIAESWGVRVETLPDGTRSARLVFGPVTYEAHVAAPWPGHDEYVRAAAERRAAAKAAA